MAAALAEEIAHHGWRPWGGVEPGALATCALEDLPELPRAIAAERVWRRIAVTPVHAGGSLVAAYLLFGRVPDDYDVAAVNTNVLSRVRRLVDATALLIARWHDRDRLVAAATRDPLTGLANRDAFADALAGCAEQAPPLYIHLHRFTSVTTRHGHDVGERVRVAVANRHRPGRRPRTPAAPS